MRGAFLPVKYLQIEKQEISTLRRQARPNGNQPYTYDRTREIKLGRTIAKRMYLTLLCQLKQPVFLAFFNCFGFLTPAQLIMTMQI